MDIEVKAEVRNYNALSETALINLDFLNQTEYAYVPGTMRYLAATLTDINGVSEKVTFDYPPDEITTVPVNTPHRVTYISETLDTSGTITVSDAYIYYIAA